MRTTPDPSQRRRGPRRRPRTASLAAILLAPLLVLTGQSASAAAEKFPEPKPDTTWFGGELEGSIGDVEDYTDALGTSVSLLSRPVNYPLTSQAQRALKDLATASREQGAVSVVSLQPTVPLADLDAADASDLVKALNGLTDDLGSTFLLRFAPEMNGTWISYGQQPTAFVAAFGDLADVVHSEAAAAQTVWSPAYGAGYPFGGSINSPVRGAVVDAAISADDRELLDTNGNGRLDARDDPYGPYFPGGAAVDWVGLSMLRYGLNQQFGANTVSKTNELQQRLEDRFGYPASVRRPSFYQRYAVGEDKPMLLLTGALFNRAKATGNPTEREVKGSWLRRVLTAARSRPRLQAVVWLESTRLEPEVGGPVRWGLTSSPKLGGAMGRVLANAKLDLGPVSRPRSAADSESAGSSQAATQEDQGRPDAGDRVSDATGLTPIQLALVLLVLLLGLSAAMFLRVRRQRMRPPWL